MPLCMLCHRNTLVQSDDCLVYIAVEINGQRAWAVRQSMAMWCRHCDYVGEVAPDLRDEVRRHVPHFEVKS